jgi:hypothetical protein
MTNSGPGATRAGSFGYTAAANSGIFIQAVRATAAPSPRVLALRIQTTMKNDPISFKILSAVILAGVILALVGPEHSAKPAVAASPLRVVTASE